MLLPRRVPVDSLHIFRGWFSKRLGTPIRVHTLPTYAQYIFDVDHNDTRKTRFETEAPRRRMGTTASGHLTSAFFLDEEPIFIVSVSCYIHPLRTL